MTGRRLAARLRFVDGLAERDFHQRVEAGGWFVEEQQVGAGGEGGDELDLLAVALGEGANLLVGIEVEAFDERLAVSCVDGPCMRPRNSSVSRPLRWGHNDGSPAT